MHLRIGKITSLCGFQDISKQSNYIKAVWQLTTKFQSWFHILRSGQDGRHFADDIFKCILLKIIFKS